MVTAPGPPAPPGEAGLTDVPARSALWAVAFLAAGALVGSVLAGGAAAMSGSTTGAGTTLAGEIGLWSGMLAAALYLTRRYGTASLRRDLGFALGWRDVGPGLLAVAIGLVITNLLGLAFAGTRFAGTNTQLISGQEHNGAGFAVVTVVVAVGAPIFEELFFRGVLRTALGRRLRGHLAVVGQAVLFGLAHYQPSNGIRNVSVMVIVGVLGLVLGYTARATRRLGPGIIAHGVFNLVQVALVLTS